MERRPLASRGAHSPADRRVQAWFGEPTKPTARPEPGEDAALPAELQEKLQVVSLERCNTSSSIESADLPRDAADLSVDRSRPFERFYYIRVRDRESAPTHKKYVAIRKSYWLYPSLAAGAADFCKEDVERVTSFAADRKSRSRWLEREAEVSAFLLSFFAGFNAKSAEFVNYIVQEARPLASFVSEYNCMGWRHVYCLRFADFDLNLGDNLHPALEVNQSVFAIESKYPFKAFFGKLLTSLFNQIRLDRLALFGQHFDPNDLKSALKFDAKSVKQVRSLQQLLSGQASKLLQKVFAGTFEAPIRLPESLCGSKFVFRPTLQHASICDALESSPG